jgi:isopenicillin N synthase-like dioxygenase
LSQTNSIPIIDIKNLREPNSSQQQLEVAQKMHVALRDIGFLYISNHGISQKLQQTLESQSQTFFSKPTEEKLKIAMAKGGKAWRGYFPVGGELTSGYPDQKEGVYFGRELDANHTDVKNNIPLHGQNQWPDELPLLKQSVLEYMQSMETLGQTLMRGVALGLGIPENYFAQRFTTEPTTLFRIFNYPRHLWSESENEWGVREHTDMGFLTILKQDNSGGLQAKARDGSWVMAPPIEDTFVINIGDMLEYWTQGIYRATPHRVRNLAPADRLSFPFFFDPNWHSTLEAIAPDLLRPTDLANVETKTQQRWDGMDLKLLTKNMTYGDFVWNKVRKVFPNLN